MLTTLLMRAFSHSKLEQWQSCLKVILFYALHLNNYFHSTLHKDCDQCLDEEPHQFEVLLLKAFALSKLGELQKVADVFNRVLHLQPDCKEVALGVQHCQIKMFKL